MTTGTRTKANDGERSNWSGYDLSAGFHLCWGFLDTGGVACWFDVCNELNIYPGVYFDDEGVKLAS